MLLVLFLLHPVFGQVSTSEALETEIKSLEKLEQNYQKLETDLISLQISLTDVQSQLEISEKNLAVTTTLYEVSLSDLESYKLKSKIWKIASIVLIGVGVPTIIYLATK